MSSQTLGKCLVLGGVALALIGALLWLSGRLPSVGQLPGDFAFKRGRFAFYFPLTTCLIVSLILSLLFRFFGRR